MAKKLPFDKVALDAIIEKYPTHSIYRLLHSFV